MRRRSRTLAVLTLLGLAAVGVEFSPAVAAPPSAAVHAAATTTAAPTTTSRPSTTTSRPTSSTTSSTSSTTTPPTTTTTVTDCTPVAPTVTSTQVRTTSLGFYYSSPSGYQCGVLRSTTLALYADAAHTSLVTSFVLPVGTQAGARNFDGLTPSTDYYLVLTLDGPGLSTAPPATRTAAAPTTTVTTRTTTTTTSYICETGGTAQVAPVTATTTTITYTYHHSGANYCSIGSSTVFAELYTDAALTQFARSWSPPGGATDGATLITGLAPSTTYYAKARTTGSLGTTVTIAPFTTAAATSTTTTTTRPTIICDPAPASATFASATTTSLTFTFSALGATGCSGTGTTTLSLYSDAAHTALVGSASSAAGATSGSLTVSALAPNTTYYPTVRLSNSPFGSPTIPAASTLTATTTTCQPIGLGGPTSTTPTSITWSLPSSLCATSLTATAYLSQSDATAQVNPVSSASVNLPAASITVTGLVSHVAYWVQFSGGFGLQGPLYTLATTATSTTTTTCDPTAATATFLSASIASLTFSFSAPGGAACGGGITTVYLYRDPAHTSAAGSASSAQGATSGTLEVKGLAPGTVYYPVVRLSTSPFSSPAMPSAATQPFGTVTSTTTTSSGKTCTGTWQTVSAWPGGFLAQIVVRNTSTVASSSWNVGWTWVGSERLTASYHATIGGTATSPTLTALDWNRVIQAGGSTTVQFQGTASGPITAPVITCRLS